MKGQNKYIFVFFIILITILVFMIFTQIDYLTVNKYIIECFTNNQTNHTVDLPLTTTYSCKNFCSPTSRCAITGQQCLADVDCPGCQPDTPASSKMNTQIEGNDDAGKLTVGVTPQYSPLTSGYGTQERIITNQLYGKPFIANWGTNTWRKEFNETRDLFNKRYKTNPLPFMQKYPMMYTTTGEFMEDEPLPANY